MPFIKEIFSEEYESCYELDSKTVFLWTKEQWENEFKKSGTKVFALKFSDKLVGICAFQIVLDEAQINYFAINKNFRRKGYGSSLMNFSINKCKQLNLKKIQLEVSESNYAANAFYKKFNFMSVGRRKNYYRGGDDAILKEKYL